MWFVQRYAKRHALEKGLVPRKGLYQPVGRLFGDMGTELE